jgi:hypothetical protein
MQLPRTPGGPDALAPHAFSEARCSVGDPAAAPRAAWERPSVTTLPRLTELTLATGGGIPGDGDIGGGSTVIP